VPEIQQSSHPAIAGIRLVLGGNVFGWTIDRDQSFRVLDAFYAAGGRMIDTAEGYSSWVPGNKGGESETIIGAWLDSRGVRSDLRIATKTGMGGTPGGLAPDKVAAALEGSLARLRTDYLDLYYAHYDEPQTPVDEVVAGFDALVGARKIRSVGASNYATDRFAAALDAADRLGLAGYSVLQPEYNLVARSEYEGALQDLCLARGIKVLPFYGLAAGFLTGKYTSANEWKGKGRAHSLDKAAGNGGWDVLAAVKDVAAETGATYVDIALGWLNAQPGIAAPLASATSPEQVAELVKAASLVLAPEQIAKLDAAVVA
jgi:aryl-alcohol dehydrogenase-like predicted oxidoreductase